MAADLGAIVASLRQTVNYHDSYSHRLPLELLVEVASHIKGNASLVAATHVCHHWRISFLASPRLWSHLDFANEERALVFLERSKSAPLSIDLTGVDGPSEIVRESLEKIAARVIMLWSAHDPYLDELLVQPMPTLEVLQITQSDRVLSEDRIQYLPSLTSLVVYGSNPLRFHVPLLTSFHITHKSGSSPGLEWTAQTLLDFLRGCPLLEVAFLNCGIMDINPNSDEVVSLPLLRSFTHESPRDRYQLYLFNHLFLPSTCRVVLVINVAKHDLDQRVPSFPTPRDASYFSDTRAVKIAVHPRNPYLNDEHMTFKIELVNSTHGAISFGRILRSCHNPAAPLHNGFLDLLGRIGIDSVETLCFDHYPVVQAERLQAAAEFMMQAVDEFRNLKKLIVAQSNIAVFLDSLRLSSCSTINTLVISSSHYTRSFYNDVVRRLQEFAVSRKKAGSPLKALTIVYPFADLRPLELEQLTRCVGCVEIVSDRDAVQWDVDKYLLGAATHKDGTSRF